MADLCFARQPIFETHGLTWGYELLYRSAPDAERAFINDPEESTIKVATALLASPDHDFAQTHCVLNVSPGFLLDGYADGLPAQGMALRVTPDDLAGPGVLEALEKVRTKGILTILGGCRSLDQAEDPHLAGFDIIDIPLPVLKAGPDWTMPASGRDRGARLLVSRIETHEEHTLAQRAGAALFQGFFFQRPKVYSVEPVSAALVHRFKILELLDSPKQNLDELTRTVESDPVLAMRLLKFVNSASFALVRTVNSVRHAISLAGWARLKNWLRLLTVNEMNPPDQSRELAYNAAIRAKFLELVCLYSGRKQLADQLYLLGLFSLLEAMLKRPFQDILTALNINPDVAQALLGERGRLLPWLNLVRSMETADWLNLDITAMKLNLDLVYVSKSKIEAMAWAKDFFSAMH